MDFEALMEKVAILEKVVEKQNERIKILENKCKRFQKAYQRRDGELNYIKKKLEENKLQTHEWRK